MNSRFPAALVARITISVGLVALLANTLDVGDILSRLAGIRLDLGLVVLSLILTDRLLCVWKWRILLCARRVQIGLWPLFRMQMTTNLLGSFLPTAVGVDVLRLVAVSSQTDKKIDAATATAIDRLIMVIATLVFATATSILAAGRYLPLSVSCFLGGGAVLCLLAWTILTGRGFGRRVSHIVRRRLGDSLSDKLGAPFRSAMGFREQPGAVLASFGIALAAIAVRIVLLYVEACALGVTVDFVPLFLVVPLVWIPLMLPVSIGGIGYKEGVFVVVLRQIGVAAPEAVAISVLEQVATRLVALPGLYYYLRGGLAAAPRSTESQTSR